MLRGCGSGESELALPDQHQIANVNKRVWKVSQYADGVPPEKKINAHERATRDAPIPERNWDHAFALSLRGEPLDKETHREKSVSNEAEDHEVAPIQTEEPVFLSNPCDSDKCKCVHRQFAALAFRLSLHKEEGRVRV